MTHSGDGDVGLSAEAGSAARPTTRKQGGDGGSGNSVVAFNDTVIAGSGGDIIVGDVARSGDGSVGLSAEAGPGGGGEVLLRPRCRVWR